MAADAIVAAPDEAFPWWRHPCPPEILSQGKGSRAYKNWRNKRYRAKRRAEFLRAVKHRESRLHASRKWFAKNKEHHRQYMKAYRDKKRAEQQRVADGLEAARVVDDPEVAMGAMASVPDAVMRPGVAADAIVAAPDEAFPWWRHPCPPEILSQGEGSRAYRTWWMKRYRAKRKAEFL